MDKPVTELKLTDKSSTAEAIVLTTIKQALAGNAGALREIWERLDGKVPQGVTGGDGGPVKVKVEYGERD